MALTSTFTTVPSTTSSEASPSPSYNVASSTLYQKRYDVCFAVQGSQNKTRKGTYELEIMYDDESEEQMKDVYGDIEKITNFDSVTETPKVNSTRNQAKKVIHPNFYAKIKNECTKK
ncbi:hypothetical protein BDF21DRAFT_422578 [Thamnidium elegans]|nr:hypothetical protein BDF21DRAFT_422578 [Thamnidium elegans]